MAHQISVAGRPLNETELSRKWFESEIEGTDKYVPVTDHSKYAIIMQYRQDLRDWQNSEDFPANKPARPDF